MKKNCASSWLFKKSAWRWLDNIQTAHPQNMYRTLPIDQSHPTISLLSAGPHWENISSTLIYFCVLSLYSSPRDRTVTASTPCRV